MSSSEDPPNGPPSPAAAPIPLAVRVFAWVLTGIVGASLLIVLGFHLVIGLRGFRLMDFWGLGEIPSHPLPGGAEAYVPFAIAAAYTFYAAIAVVFLCLVACWLSLISHRWRAAMWFGIIAVSAFVPGFFAFEIGLVLAGV